MAQKVRGHYMATRAGEYPPDAVRWTDELPYTVLHAREAGAGAFSVGMAYARVGYYATPADAVKAYRRAYPTDAQYSGAVVLCRGVRVPPREWNPFAV